MVCMTGIDTSKYYSLPSKWRAVDGQSSSDFDGTTKLARKRRKGRKEGKLE
jgi:hypothetical protein